MSHIVYATRWSFVDFKADMYNIHVWVQKDPTKEWTKLQFIAMDDAIFIALEKWPPEWCAPDLAGMEKDAAQ